jgi:predicted nucleic acid-binding protein
MKRLRIYLDTSVINFLFVDDAPDLRQITIDFFAQHASQFDLFISDVVVHEISRDPNPQHRGLLLSALSEHGVLQLPDDHRAEIEVLARRYLEARIIPPDKIEDALHVAYATVYEVDFLLSWNFKHLANAFRETRFMAVNQELGYRHPLRLLSPMEVENETD